MQRAADLIRAIATLIWPLGVISLIVVFRTELRALTRRLRRLSLFGQQVELGEALNTLETQAQAAVAIEGDRSGSGERDESDEAGTADILRLAATSPRVALIALNERLERSLRRLLASAGWASDAQIRRASLAQLIDLVPPQALPQRDAFIVFDRVRNSMIHGGESVDERDILRAIDSGLTLMESLRSFPIETHIVVAVEPLFTDAQCTQESARGRAVVLEIRVPEGISLLRREVWPTSKPHYKPGMEVGSEWDTDASHGWTEVWVRDPESGSPRRIPGTLDFIGRDLTST